MLNEETKCRLVCRCKNQELKDMVLDQYLQQVPSNRGKFIKSSVKVLGGTCKFEFSLSMHSTQIPVLMYGYKEGIHTEEEVNKSNNFEISIKCRNEEMAKNISGFIRNQLLGLDEYVHDKIVLNVEKDTVLVLFGAECDYYPIFLFIEE